MQHSEMAMCEMSRKKTYVFSHVLYWFIPWPGWSRGGRICRKMAILSGNGVIFGIVGVRSGTSDR